MKEPTIRKPLRRVEHVVLDNFEPSLTKQSFKDETDINFIIRKYHKTGIVEHVRRHQGRYGDFTNIDFHEAMNAVAEARSMFESLPANVRKEFDNDPGVFLSFAEDPANLDRMVELGLAEAPVPPPPPGTPDPVPPVEEAES